MRAPTLAGRYRPPYVSTPADRWRENSPEVEEVDRAQGREPGRGDSRMTKRARFQNPGRSRRPLSRSARLRTPNPTSAPSNPRRGNGRPQRGSVLAAHRGARLGWEAKPDGTYLDLAPARSTLPPSSPGRPGFAPCDRRRLRGPHAGAVRANRPVPPGRRRRAALPFPAARFDGALWVWRTQSRRPRQRPP